MTGNSFEGAIGTVARRRRLLGIPRRVALLGGTTTLGDCAVAVRYLADARRLVDGPVIADYERAFARRVGVRYAYSFSAGRVGLYGLLRLLEIGSGDEVLLQVPTHIVVPNAIRYTGAQPVYVDCRLEDYNMDLELAERQITPRTKALILQHTFGIPADLDRAVALADRHGLALIEDCVHSLGSKYGGQQVGTFGKAAFFSTEETKTISSTMGGMVVTDDQALAAKLQAYQATCARPSASLSGRYVLKLALYHLLTQPYLHSYARSLYDLFGRRNPLPQATSAVELRGVRPDNYEQGLSNAQAALALRQLKRLDGSLAHRKAVSNIYAALLSQYGFRLPQVGPKAEPAFVRYPVWVPDRDAAIRATASHVVLGTWFTSVLEEAASPAYAGYEMGSCPRAEAAAIHLINLPTHLRVKPYDVEAITSALAKLAPTEKSS
ncbi:MAG TPA: DegT/DnrJ/EryC1/StrS aminotransferase family protein [Chloroflexota bacterium]|nr:DegT/DnrJ/EryC1/StrS aminotransferase family protein [Chloroflexota bacterium]